MGSEASRNQLRSGRQAAVRRSSRCGRPVPPASQFGSPVALSRSLACASRQEGPGCQALTECLSLCTQHANKIKGQVLLMCMRMAYKHSAEWTLAVHLDNISDKAHNQWLCSRDRHLRHAVQ